jgi:hypothetical protein
VAREFHILPSGKEGTRRASRKAKLSHSKDRTVSQYECHCIPFCIPDGVFSAKSRQSWQKVKVSKLLILRVKTVIVPQSKSRQKVQKGIFSPLLYQLSYPA